MVLENSFFNDQKSYSAHRSVHAATGRGFRKLPKSTNFGRFGDTGCPEPLAGIDDWDWKEAVTVSNLDFRAAVEQK